ncbi:carbon storage regulator [Sphingomonas sp.]|uniref:carbon storage regulator n=1 Tax=Sphingomonas sp. TaxID=28214 RepID=UPI0025DE4995|nr:carbon storage regulator [Sphingomonas sp.]
MLVLSRFVDEEVVITLGGEEVVICVNEIRHGKRVRLGFTAPAAVKIHRREVADEIAAGQAAVEEPVSAPC